MHEAKKMQHTIKSFLAKMNTYKGKFPCHLLQRGVGQHSTVKMINFQERLCCIVSIKLYIVCTIWKSGPNLGLSEDECPVQKVLSFFTFF